MLSLINVKIMDEENLLVKNATIQFQNGHIYGLYTAEPAQLDPLLLCISGHRSWQQGALINSYSSIPAFLPWKNVLASWPAGQTMLTTAGAAPEEEREAPACLFNQDIVLISHLQLADAGITSNNWIQELQDSCTQQDRIIIITSSDYQSLKQVCDTICVFDNHEFQLMIRQADFPAYEEYLENVFKPQDQP